MTAHAFRLTPFLFGLAFLATAAVWALWEIEVIALTDLRFVGPALLVLAGLAGVVATIASTRNQS